MKTKKITMTMVLLLVVTTAAWADPPPEDVRFSGGSYDGWAREVMAEYASLELPVRGTVISIR